MFTLRVRGVPDGSPALDATPGELLALWRSRPPDEQLQAARSAARAARHIAGNVCRTHRRIFEAFIETKPEVVLVRDEGAHLALPDAIVIREWKIGAPSTTMFREGEPAAAFLGRVAEQVLRCSTTRYLHRTTTTLDGAVIVPRVRSACRVHDDDEYAWARLLVACKSS